jgi:hypothetical protein
MGAPKTPSITAEPQTASIKIRAPGVPRARAGSTLDASLREARDEVPL